MVNIIKMKTEELLEKYGTLLIEYETEAEALEIALRRTAEVRGNIEEVENEVKKRGLEIKQVD